MNNNIYDWVFVKNPYTKKWMAAQRDHKDDLYNHIDSPNILKSSSVETLERLIEKTGGDPEKIAELLANQEIETSAPVKKYEQSPSRKVDLKTGQTKVV